MHPDLSPWLKAMEEKMSAKIMREARAQNQDVEVEEDLMLAGKSNQQRQVWSAGLFRRNLTSHAQID